jgi:LysM repeat protein
MFQQIQGTPYSNYQADIATQWATVQSTCSVSYPTSVPTPISNLTSIPGFAPTSVVFSQPCLSGNTYTVVSGDNVQAISQNVGCATGTLIAINNLLPDGSDLQAGQSLCLPFQCQLHTVASNDTCYGIASSANITYTAFLGYNPTINPYCTNLILGRSVCLSPPGGTYTPTTISGVIPTQTAVYATATVAPPGPTAHGTTANCGKYYQVQPGDFCQVVAINQTIALPLFEAINPSIDLACDNLTPGLWYCVLPLQFWNQTGNATTPTVVPAPTVTPDGSTDDCYQWYVVQPGDFCALIESSYGITFTQLQMWNPDLTNDCSNLLAGEAYCVNSPVTTSLVTAAATTAPTTAATTAAATTTAGTSTTNTQAASTTVPAPTTTVSGTTSDCYQWYVVKSGDTCFAVDTSFSITFAQFLTWNQGVNSDCSNLEIGIAYCVNSPIPANSKVKRMPIDLHRMAKRGDGPRGWPIAGDIGNSGGLPPKFPGRSPIYDQLVS